MAGVAAGHRSQVSALAAHGAILARAGYLAHAERWLLTCLDQFDDASMRCLLGKVQAQQGRLEEARSTLQQSLRVDPDHVSAREALASVDRGLSVSNNSSRLAAVVFCTLVVAAIALSVLWQGGAERREAIPAAVRNESPQTVASEAEARPIDMGKANRALTSPAMVASAPETALAPLERTARLRAIEQYAQFAAGLSRHTEMARLSIEVLDEGHPLHVRLGGTLPSLQLRDRLREAAARFPGLRIDETAVAVDHRYLVRRGDNLASIAVRLYGREARWGDLARANRARLGPRYLLYPGQWLVVP